MTRILGLAFLAACTGKDTLECPEGMVRNFEGDCILIDDGGTDTDTDTDTDTGDTGDTGKDYDVCSEDAPHAAIQDAIDAAASGDTITVCPEVFYENLTLDKAITLTGDAEGARPRIYGGGDDVVLTISAGADGATVSHMLLRDGEAKPGDDSAGIGAGVRVEGAAVTLTDLQINDSIAATRGGGLALIDSDALVEDVTITGGRSGELGGGVYVQGGTPTFHRLRVETSYSVRGGGMYATDTPMTLRGGVFFQNDVQQDASAILIEDGQGAVLSNMVVALNTGGIKACSADTEDGAIVYNTIAFNNEGIGLCVASSSEYNLSYANTTDDFQIGGASGPGDNDLVADPFFRDGPSGDFVIRDNSPCVDAGNPDADYNDADSSRADIGAYGGPEGYTAD